MNERRFNAALADRLDNPARLLWLPPTIVLDALVVQAGDSIADIGAGTGYFTLPLAQAAGPLGQVYAVDSQAEMLGRLRQKLDESVASNVDLILAEADETGLPAFSCNLFFIANVWHELDDRTAVLRESMRVLKTGGRVAILDWRPDVEPENGPPLDHRLSASMAAEELQCAGFLRIVQANAGKYSWLVQGEKRQ